jgi:hypothetical protein
MGGVDSEVLEVLRSLDLGQLAPDAALQLLAQLKERLTN